jgi:hypothetical protein
MILDDDGPERAESIQMGSSLIGEFVSCVADWSRAVRLWRIIGRCFILLY